MPDTADILAPLAPEKTATPPPDDGEVEVDVDGVTGRLLCISLHFIASLESKGEGNATDWAGAVLVHYEITLETCEGDSLTVHEGLYLAGVKDWAKHNTVNEDLEIVWECRLSSPKAKSGVQVDYVL
jgi:hypothetical protein